ncbi:hypothetical protein AAC387_Pa06g1050 [Persea americana]
MIKKKKNPFHTKITSDQTLKQPPQRCKLPAIPIKNSKTSFQRDLPLKTSKAKQRSLTSSTHSNSSPKPLSAEQRPRIPRARTLVTETKEEKKRVREQHFAWIAGQEKLRRKIPFSQALVSLKVCRREVIGGKEQMESTKTHQRKRKN